MKKRDKLSLWPALLEMFIIMLVLMSGIELLKHFGRLKITTMEWNIITVLFAAVIACIVSYFLLKKHIKHNRQLIIEIRYLKKMEEDLKIKVNELSHFKDLIVWWEKKVIGLEEETKKIKDRLAMHEQTGM